MSGEQMGFANILSQQPSGLKTSIHVAGERGCECGHIDVTVSGENQCVNLETSEFQF